MHAGNKSNLISFVLLSILEGTFILILQIRQSEARVVKQLTSGHTAGNYEVKIARFAK